MYPSSCSPVSYKSFYLFISVFSFNQAKPKTDVEARVYEVLSHKNWGSSSTLMNEIARDTFDYDRFAIVSQIMWESLENQRPAAWRVIFKGLTLLEHLIKHGSERVVDDARGHGHTLRSLHQFNYYEGTVDRGSGVREKSKQLVELLQDDERIREERMQARKLREKFGGNLGGVSGGGGSSGGGGRYAGYGNDEWSSGGGGGGGGYGDGGIGSEKYRSGGSPSRGGGGGYSGRYDNDEDTRSSSAPQPTFASMPDDPRSKTKKKKKKPVAEAAPAPEVDLFSFDAPPAPAPAPAFAADPQSEEFGAFESTGSSAAAADPFATPAASSNAQFAAFGGSTGGLQQSSPMMQPPQQQQNAQFDAFGNMGGGGNVMGGSSNAMSGGGFQSNNTQTAAADDDEFGDFADAAPAKTASAAKSGSNDPLGNLISLDGLTKNSSKKEDKLNEPVIANSAAATFVQEQSSIQQNIQQGKKGSAMSFEGLDGLQKPSMGMNMGMTMPSSMAMPSNPGVMGGTGSGATGLDAISAMDPQAMMPNRTPNQVAGGMANPQMMGGQQPMMGGQQMMGNNPQMMVGMNVGMQQQGFGGMQGMGMNSNMGMMNPQQQQMMMNNQGGMQGGGGFGGQMGMMGGQQQSGNMNQMGGQSMGGF